MVSQTNLRDNFNGLKSKTKGCCWFSWKDDRTAKSFNWFQILRNLQSGICTIHYSLHETLKYYNIFKNTYIVSFVTLSACTSVCVYVIWWTRWCLRFISWTFSFLFNYFFSSHRLSTLNTDMLYVIHLKRKRFAQLWSTKKNVF